MTPLMIASQAGHVEMVEQLIKSGADVNLRNSSGDTALIYAFNDLSRISVISRNINDVEKIEECVQLLLKHDADVNIQGIVGDTALMHLARRASHYLELFPNSQFKIKHFTRDEKLSVMEKCTFALIDAGADPNLKNDEGHTALIIGANILRFVRKWSRLVLM